MPWPFSSRRRDSAAAAPHPPAPTQPRVPDSRPAAASPAPSTLAAAPGVRDVVGRTLAARKPTRGLVDGRAAAAKKNNSRKRRKKGPPVAGPPELYARRLLQWLEEEGAEGPLLFADLFDIYQGMCRVLGWAPRPWDPVGHQFARITTGGRKPYAEVMERDGLHRRRIYPLPWAACAPGAQAGDAGCGPCGPGGAVSRDPAKAEPETPADTAPAPRQHRTIYDLGRAA